MSGLAGQAIGLATVTAPIGEGAAVTADSRGCMENFIGFNLNSSNADPLPEDFNAPDDQVHSANDGTTVKIPVYYGTELMWEDTAPAHALPVNTILPDVYGNPVEGELLTVDDGVWTGYPTPYVSHVWQRDGVSILGQYGKTYVPTLLDVGKEITVLEIATNSVGSVNAASNIMVIQPAVGVPTNVTPPKITGSPTVGSTLTVTPGTWVGNPTPTLTYRWYLGNNSPLQNTSLTLAVDLSYEDALLKVVETASNAVGVEQVYTNSVLITG